MLLLGNVLPNLCQYHPCDYNWGIVFCRRKWGIQFRLFQNWRRGCFLLHGIPFLRCYPSLLLWLIKLKLLCYFSFSISQHPFSRWFLSFTWCWWFMYSSPSQKVTRPLVPKFCYWHSWFWYPWRRSSIWSSGLQQSLREKSNPLTKKAAYWLPF